MNAIQKEHENLLTERSEGKKRKTERKRERDGAKMAATGVGLNGRQGKSEVMKKKADQRV